MWVKKWPAPNLLFSVAAEAHNMQTDPHIIMISGWAGTVLDSGRSKKYLSRGVSDQKSFVILIKSPAITIIQDHFEVIYSHETCFWTEKHLEKHQPDLSSIWRVKDPRQTIKLTVHQHFCWSSQLSRWSTIPHPLVTLTIPFFVASPNNGNKSRSMSIPRGIQNFPVNS